MAGASGTIRTKRFDRKFRLQATYFYSRITNTSSLSHGPTQAEQARTADHGRALERRRMFHSRNPGSLSGRHRPAYTTIQTTVYRLEAKKALRRVRKIGNAHIFEAAVSRHAAQGRLIDDLLALFGGRAEPVMCHLVETGKLTLDDVKQAEKGR